MTGWTAKNVPDEIRNKPEVSSQWNILNSRLFNLYNASAFVNGQYKDNPEKVFPVGLTLGSSRRHALIGEPGESMPKTPKRLDFIIIIDKMECFELFNLKKLKSRFFSLCRHLYR